MKVSIKKCGFLIGMVLFCGALVSASDVSAVRAQGRLAKITGQLKPVEKHIEPASVAATADFLKIPEYCRVVRHKWKDHLAQFASTVVKQMLENEERYKSDYYVFYHAQRADNRIIVEFLKNLYEFVSKKPLRSDFEFLRFWGSGSKIADVNTYLNAFWFFENDLYAHVRANLLAVNPVLFGNFNDWGECSFDYFLQNRSIGSLVASVLRTIFSSYGFKVKYINQLLAINERFSTDTGDIVQIFIPKALVDDCAYLSKTHGVPRRKLITDKKGNPLALGDYDKTRKRYIRSSGILDVIQNNIGAIKDSESMQFRLFFARSGPLMNPDQGAKIFRFTTLTPKRLQEYSDQVRKVSKKTFARYKGNVPLQAPSAVDVPPVPADTPRELTVLEQQEVGHAVEGLVIPRGSMDVDDEMWWI